MESLGELRWRRWRLTLRNTRNLFGRTPPLVAFEAIFKHGVRRGQFPPAEPWHFHPLDGPPGARVRLDREYPLAVVFPTAGEAAVRGFAAGVAEHLAVPEHNFALAAGPVEERHLAALAAERPDLEAAGDEVCLDFLTPYEITRRDPARPWHVTAEDFFAALVARLRRLFGPGVPAPPAAAVGAVTLLPCCWHYEEHRHRSRSGTGTHFLKGWRGPLYLRGPVAPLLPWLRLAAELHATDPATFGRAHAVLRLGRPHFDAALRNPTVWRAAYEELAAQVTEPEPFYVPLTPAREGASAMSDRSTPAAPAAPAGEEEDEDEDEPGRGEGLPGPLARLLGEIRAGTWQPRPARAFAVPKKSGGERLAVQLAGPDRLVHRVLHRVLAPALDRLLEEAACGFRPGRGVGDARRAIARAWQEGCTWVLEADIAAFFDSVPWGRLHAKLDAVLPRADAWTRALLRAAVETPVERAGQPLARTQGLLQGSPLSPLLANLYLDEFDERAARAGLRLVRYADDFVVLCRSQAEAEQARDTVATLLADLGLELRADKTALTPAEAGFTFLGLELGADLEEAVVEASTLRKTVWVREPGAWLALDADELEVRAGDTLLLGVPLARVGEIIVAGAGGVSTALLRRCLELRIPVSFCAPTGHYAGTLRPDSQAAWELGGRHFARREALSPAQVCAAARLWVEAKLANYLAWMREHPGAPVAALEDARATLPACGTVEALRGVEGAATRAAFRWVNGRALDPAWHSAGRQPGTQPDRWNSLLDFGYFLLFTRLNVLLRTRGLNPYLGFLHSPTDHFESLVCDVQEPFRPRVERWALNLANRGVVRPADCEPPAERRGWRLGREALRRVVQAWEREQHLRRAGDPGTLGQLLAAQADALAAWARDGAVLQVYHALRNAPPARLTPDGMENRIGCNCPAIHRQVHPAP